MGRRRTFVELSAEAFSLFPTCVERLHRVTAGKAGKTGLGRFLNISNFPFHIAFPP